MSSKGVIVGTDAKSSWLLPWWWKFYSRHNTLPVTFFNFGMEQKSLKWCQRHGAVLDCKNPIVLSLPTDKMGTKEAFEKWCGKDQMESFRQAVFKKPFAMQMTPYDKTIWIDLDCEICDSIEPLFDVLNESIDFAIGGYPKTYPYLETMTYNSGVVVFKKKAPFLEKWTEACIEKNGEYTTDDTLLTALIKGENLRGTFLHPEWNWLMRYGINPFAKIRHWVMQEGKDFIKNHDSFQDFRP